MKNSFELDVIKFSKGGYRSDNLTFEECFSIMCDAHYGNGYPVSWKPSDEWILNRCMNIYKKYFNINDFSNLICYEMYNTKLLMFQGSQSNLFDNKTWKTLIATQLLFKFIGLSIYQVDELKES